MHLQMKLSFGSSSDETAPLPAVVLADTNDSTLGEDVSDPVCDPRHEGAMSLFDLCKTLAKLRHDLNITVTPEFAGRVALLVRVPPSTCVIALLILST
jgi:hypothetical protein